MRVSTAFNKMLAIPGAWIDDVAFGPREVVVRLRRRRRKLRCPCGYTTRARFDRSIRRWRHIDLGACKLIQITGRAKAPGTTSANGADPTST